MATICYLHGFGSSGVSAKSTAIRKAFPNDTVLSPNIPTNPVDAVRTVTDIVCASMTDLKNVNDFPLIFVGTSLGGFWANYFAQKFDAPAVLVNPSTSPSCTMQPRVGMDVNNYVTGEKIVVTDADVAEYARLEAETAAEYNGALIDVFLAQDDDVIPFGDTILALPFTRSMSVTADGGHRYDTKWGTVIEKLAEIKDRK